MRKVDERVIIMTSKNSIQGGARFTLFVLVNIRKWVLCWDCMLRGRVINIGIIVTENECIRLLRLAPVCFWARSIHARKKCFPSILHFLNFLWAQFLFWHLACSAAHLGSKQFNLSLSLFCFSSNATK